MDIKQFLKNEKVQFKHWKALSKLGREQILDAILDGEYSISILQHIHPNLRVANLPTNYRTLQIEWMSSDALKLLKESGKVLECGFPALGDNNTTAQTPSYGKHDPRGGSRTIKVQEKTLAILDGYKLSDLKRRPQISNLWNDIGLNNTLDSWSTEASIQSHAQAVLKEIRRYANIEPENLEIHLETNISSAIDNLRADISVIRSAIGDILAVCVVKKPSKLQNQDLSNQSLYTQISNYMQELRHTFGTKYVFGFITTYKEWKVCWLSNVNYIAQCSSEQDIESFIKNDKDEYPFKIEDDSICCTKTFSYNDPALVELLVSCFRKMVYSFSNRPKDFNIHSFEFRCIESEKGISYWKFIPKTLNKFTYKMPTKQTRNFYLLRNYHGVKMGGSG